MISTFFTFFTPPPQLKLRGLAQAAIDSESLAAKQTKGSSIILTVLAPRPPTLLPSPLLDPSLAVTRSKETLGTSRSSPRCQPRSTSSRPGAGANWWIHQGALQPPSCPARGAHLQACDLPASARAEGRGGGRRGGGRGGNAGGSRGHRRSDSLRGVGGRSQAEGNFSSEL